MPVLRTIRRTIFLAGILVVPVLIDRVRHLDQPCTVFDLFEEFQRGKEFDAVTACWMRGSRKMGNGSLVEGSAAFPGHIQTA